MSTIRIFIYSFIQTSLLLYCTAGWANIPYKDRLKAAAAEFKELEENHSDIKFVSTDLYRYFYTNMIHPYIEGSGAPIHIPEFLGSIATENLGKEIDYDYAYILTNDIARFARKEQIVAVQYSRINNNVDHFFPYTYYSIGALLSLQRLKNIELGRSDEALRLQNHLIRHLERFLTFSSSSMIADHPWESVFVYLLHLHFTDFDAQIAERLALALSTIIGNKNAKIGEVTAAQQILIDLGFLCLARCKTPSLKPYRDRQTTQSYIRSILSECFYKCREGIGENPGEIQRAYLKLLSTTDPKAHKAALEFQLERQIKLHLRWIITSLLMVIRNDDQNIRYHILETIQTTKQFGALLIGYAIFFFPFNLVLIAFSAIILITKGENRIKFEKPKFERSNRVFCTVKACFTFIYLLIITNISSFIKVFLKNTKAAFVSEKSIWDILASNGLVVGITLSITSLESYIEIIIS